MTGRSGTRTGPWIGSLALHALVVLALAATALRWRAEPPEPQLAIEGSVVRYEDLPPSARAGKPLQESTPVQRQSPPAAQPVPEPGQDRPPEPVPARRETGDAAARAKAEDVERERQARLKQQAAQREAELQRKAEEQRAASERHEAEALAREREAAAEREKAVRDQQAARDARLKAERERDVQRALAAEEEGEAIARSGVVDEYRSLLIQAIERNWIRPPSARQGLECTLYVTQAPGGVVIDVRLGDCNGDQAVRESVTNAVYRSSPLPPPRDPRAFERRLVMVFKPKE